MKVRIEIDEAVEEDEVIIRCSELKDYIAQIQKTISGITPEAKTMVLLQDSTEFYVSMKNILFFETSDNGINAHTKSDIYKTKYRLYELEEFLPGYFVRISKSTILNINCIYSITRNLTGASAVSFSGTHKQVYVSRSYYSLLKSKLEEKRTNL